MKRILVLMPVVFILITSCKLFHKSGSTAQSGTSSSDSGSSGTASQRWNMPERPISDSVGDTVIITGTTYMPLYGRREAGVPDSLEGTWELESMSGGKGFPDNPEFIDEIKERIRIKDSIANAKNIQPTPATRVPPPPPPPPPPVNRKHMRQRHDTLAERYAAQQTTATTTGTEAEAALRLPPITPPQHNDYHKPDRPTIRFYGSNETFSGFSGCNRYSGRYELPDSNSINFKGAERSTRMRCLVVGYDDEDFIDALKRVNKFKARGGRLELMSGGEVLFVFNKKSNEP